MISQNYCAWKAQMLDIYTCHACRELHGKVYEFGKKFIPKPPIHPNCRCKITEMQACFAGETTGRGANGADWWLKMFGKLPDYYITMKEAKKSGWKPNKGNLQEILPGKMIVGGVYHNKNGHLPTAEGRIWYEADLEYSGRYRGMSRIVFSNDGLIFVTFDHYETYVEIV
ncbi:MAG: phage head morphogenesis protein [Oscillospiraceae bacterium]|nr:phage head morphogenesis protein [Oscillospiraceae bacterium]MBQ3224467.1 phage head morphogenesis protein [Oscillospiraceae bacterium]MBQ6698777.1 phage head morphogenesis protein [Oscillospiraceae bacterium]MBQ7054433.1 phage head morphogenesis protein [Oscillospiraceae bacterium]